MTLPRLRHLLGALPSLRILVLGDYFLDRYLDIDPALAETSLETGLQARQVTGIRNSPGAAGTVTNNLSALGVGKVLALGVLGDDGQGFDLARGLEATGVDTSPLIRLPGRFTPTYTKPIDRASGKEMERLDIKNRTPTPPDVEDRLIAALRDLLPSADALIVLDQVQEAECGVITSRVREAVEAAALAHPELPVLADSRTRIHDFRHVILKPNRQEAMALSSPGTDDALSRAAVALAARSGRPLFITLGPDGILAALGPDTWRIPGIRVEDPIDTVGAGDSVSASVVSALAAGATIPEAALLGVLVSSITIQQIGTTGVARPGEVLARFREEYPAASV